MKEKKIQKEVGKNKQIREKKGVSFATLIWSLVKRIKMYQYWRLWYCGWGWWWYGIEEAADSKGKGYHEYTWYVSDESRKAGEEETTSITVDHCSRYCSLQRVYGEFFTSKWTAKCPIFFPEDFSS